MFAHLPGPIPTEIGRLTACTVLRLWDNKFQGTLCKLALANHVPRFRTALHRLTLWSVFLGCIPREIGRLTNLQRLNLAGNMLSGL